MLLQVRVQIESLPPPVQDKASRLMNQTMENLQDKVGRHVTAAGHRQAGHRQAGMSHTG